VTDVLFADIIVVIATTALAAMTCVLSWCLAPLRRRTKLRRGRSVPTAAPGQGAPQTRPRSPAT
jgi:hypothetical protein